MMIRTTRNVRLITRNLIPFFIPFPPVLYRKSVRPGSRPFQLSLSKRPFGFQNVEALRFNKKRDPSSTKILRHDTGSGTAFFLQETDKLYRDIILSDPGVEDRHIHSFEGLRGQTSKKVHHGRGRLKRPGWGAQ